MRATRVRIEISESDLEWTINQFLSPEVSVRNLRLTRTGAHAVISAPMITAEVVLQVTSHVRDRTAASDAVAVSVERHVSKHDVVDSHHLADDNKHEDLLLQIDLQVKKWLTVPKKLIAYILQKYVGQSVEGVRVEGTTLWVDVAQVLTAVLRAERIDIELSDGQITVQGQGVELINHTP
jgi:hypothetical protein